MAMGHRLYLGLPTRLAPDSRFVTLAFARMISWAYWLSGGVTIGAARAVLGVSVLIGLSLVYALSVKMKLRAMGASLVALLALHPWTVWWSRSVVVPYAIALVLAVLGPLGWLYATSLYREGVTGSSDAPGWTRHLALVLAGQALAAILHFTPFAAIPLISCALWTLSSDDGRRSLRTPGPWLALVGVLSHALPIVLDVRTVLDQARPSPRFRNFDERWRNFVRSILDGYSGEQTLRDYVGDNAAMSLGLTSSRLAVVLVLGGALWIILGRRDRHAQDERGLRASVLRFVPRYWLVALLCFPWVLAPARDWWLATIDSERYFFVLLAPGALLVAATTLCAPRRCAVMIAALCVYFVLGPNLRAARYFWQGGGPDHGYFSAHRGGGYRGYKVLPGPRSVTVAIHEACRDASRGEPMTIAFNDYAFHPVRVLIRAKPDHHLNSVYLRQATLPRGRLLCVPVWPEAMFEAGHIPGFAVQENRWTRDYVLRRMEQSRRIAAWTQPNGFPLVELYVGRVSEHDADRIPE
jgi:hypothetical protein